VVATVVEVETIIWSGPAMAILGLWIAILSINRDSIRLLAFGLLCPIVTSLIALLIATFQIGPGTASSFVWALLALNAIVTVVWWLLLRQQIFSGSSDDGKSAREPVRYSILHMLIGMTIVSLVLALIRPFIGLGEMTLFAGYGIAILMASLAILLWFARRSRRGDSDRSVGVVGVSDDVQP
jgi:hypothetical protein